ncbi:MAG TPA: type VI secretion system accessory protein TagJ [Pseudacidobacterium sp.]|jgi:type VI secretion system protein ImpE|nr:type VI secretion system accessory protein TagJ [Pseudacidobacterium sp.]
MDGLSYYRDGQLQLAINALGDELKKQPLDARRRTFLFELLCFAGEYDRAGKQLDILSDSSKEAAAGTMLYRAALHAEKTRQEMFAKDELPMGTTHPVPSGILNGQEFTSLQDADPRIGANLEVFIAGSYTWIPFAYVESVEMQAPKKLRDLLWIPAVLHTTEDFRLQDLGEVLLPALAPLSWKHPDDAVRLGRATAWEDNEKHGAVPYGQKLLLRGDEEEPFLELRNLTFKHTREAAESATP